MPNLNSSRFRAAIEVYQSEVVTSAELMAILQNPRLSQKRRPVEPKENDKLTSLYFGDAGLGYKAAHYTPARSTRWRSLIFSHWTHSFRCSTRAC
jgi:hypothetical protein